MKHRVCRIYVPVAGTYTVAQLLALAGVKPRPQDVPEIRAGTWCKIKFGGG